MEADTGKLMIYKESIQSARKTKCGTNNPLGRASYFSAVPFLRRPTFQNVSDIK